ncbi:hypothetical protein BaRGS_00000612 [Batillaria attramentaria]|uniref:Uncharacterized protein n=1 Tax=Batillaria attramentaria TaxID=370345 RepID=A0ABD0M970_9CAEN
MGNDVSVVVSLAAPAPTVARGSPGHKQIISVPWRLTRVQLMVLDANCVTARAAMVFLKKKGGVTGAIRKSITDWTISPETP